MPATTKILRAEIDYAKSELTVRVVKSYGPLAEEHSYSVSFQKDVTAELAEVNAELAGEGFPPIPDEYTASLAALRNAKHEAISEVKA